MRRRADAEQVQDHQLAVVLPARIKEAALGLPAHGQQVRMAVQHPREIDALIHGRRVSHDGPVVAKALAGGQHAGKQERGVDRRQLALPLASARLRVDEVIEPPALVRHPAPRGTEASCGRGRATASRGAQPRSAAMHRRSARSPVAAMLRDAMTADVARRRRAPGRAPGRLGVSPCSQKYRNERRSRSSSSVSSSRESARMASGVGRKRLVPCDG